jgi:GTPase SAR1 family protein
VSSIVIGQHDGHAVRIDVGGLLRGRLLIQGGSGSGKSWLLRRLCEEIFGKIQVIVIDPEGEFATLREKFGYVLVGKGGETPADPRSAALLAHKLLELKASAVCDLYEMKPFARHEWVKNFCDALVDAEKNLWHPCVIVIDEAHTFCPEKGAGESVASEAVIGLATRGRKRGYALVLATQRLGKLRKDAASELQNLLIGKTFIDVDRKRAADALGVYGKDTHAFFDEIKMLKRGTFFALGAAISDERILVEIGGVQTTHPEAGSSKHASEPPPAPEAIAKMLPQLKDLPKAAEEKAKTEAELRTEIRSLKAKLAAPPSAPVVDTAKVKELEALVHALNAYADKTENFISKQAGAMRDAIGTLEDMCKIQPPSPDLRKVSAAVAKYIPAGSSFVNPKPFTPENRPKPYLQAPIGGNGDLSGPQRKILTALAELLSIGKETPPKAMVAAWAGYSVEGGAFGNPIGALRAGGYVDYPSPGTVMLTDAGKMSIGPRDTPDQEEIHRRIKSTCTGPEQKIIGVLFEMGEPRDIDKNELAERAGYSPIGGAFGNPLGALRTKGLLDYPRPGVVKAADWLFAF